jgi:hypothetical protein
VTATTGAGSRRRGKGWELACRKALTSLGIPCRAPQAGESGDDIVLLDLRWLSVEAKDQTRDALPSWIDQAVRQAGAERLGAVWHKRRGRPDALDGFVTMRASDFWRLVNDARTA